MTELSFENQAGFINLNIMIIIPAVTDHHMFTRLPTCHCRLFWVTVGLILLHYCFRQHAFLELSDFSFEHATSAGFLTSDWLQSRKQTTRIVTHI